MGQLGADVEALDRLAKRFDEEAQRLTQAVSQITSQVQSAWWKGSDAERFKGDWNGQYAAQLRRVADALRQVGQVARRQSADQRRTSQG